MTRLESQSCSVVSDSSWNSSGLNTGVSSCFLLWGILPTQGSSPGLPYCRRILYQLSHQGSPRILECVAYLQGIFPTQESNWGLLYCRRILYQLSHQRRPSCSAATCFCRSFLNLCPPVLRLPMQESGFLPPSQELVFLSRLVCLDWLAWCRRTESSPTACSDSRKG